MYQFFTYSVRRLLVFAFACTVIPSPLAFSIAASPGAVRSRRDEGRQAQVVGSQLQPPALRPCSPQSGQSRLVPSLIVGCYQPLCCEPSRTDHFTQQASKASVKVGTRFLLKSYSIYLFVYQLRI